MRDTSDLSTEPVISDAVRRAVVRELARSWWLLLLLGVFWVLFGMFVLSYRVGSLLALAVMAGVAFLLSGVAELTASTRVPSWRWLYIVGGLLSIIAGLTALVWPAITLFALSVVLSWF